MHWLANAEAPSGICRLQPRPLRPEDSPKKDKTPVREAPGVCCARGWMPRILWSKGPASGSRSSSAGMNRIKFVGFASQQSCNCLSHLSAFAHPGAACSIAGSSLTAPALPPQCVHRPRPCIVCPVLVLTPVGAAHSACNHRGAAAHACPALGRRAVRMSFFEQGVLL